VFLKIEFSFVPFCTNQSDFGAVGYLRQFFLITEVAKKIWTTFSTVQVKYEFGQKMSLVAFWAIFSQIHLSCSDTQVFKDNNNFR
jgi:hypothetical protein